MARSNAKTHFLFAIDGGATHTDTAHGGGYGAWAKMWRRTTEALFPGVAASLVNADDATRLVVRVDGADVVVRCVELPCR